MKRLYSQLTSPSRKESDTDTDTDICSICLDTYKATCNMYCTRTPCGHIFHSTCLSKWSSLHNNCPICRGEINCCMVSSEPINPYTNLHNINNIINNNNINNNNNNNINNNININNNNINIRILNRQVRRPDAYVPVLTYVIGQI